MKPWSEIFPARAEWEIKGHVEDLQGNRTSVPECKRLTPAWSNIKYNAQATKDYKAPEKYGGYRDTQRTRKLLPLKDKLIS